MHQLHASPEPGLIKCLGWGESQAKEWENAVLWFLLRLLHLTTTTTTTRQSFQHLASRRQWGDRRLAAPAQPSPGQLQLEWEPCWGWQVESAAAWRQQSAWLPNEILTAAGNSQLPAASHRGFLSSLLPPVHSQGPDCDGSWRHGRLLLLDTLWKFSLKCLPPILNTSSRHSIMKGSISMGFLLCLCSIKVKVWNNFLQFCTPFHCPFENSHLDKFEERMIHCHEHWAISNWGNFPIMTSWQPNFKILF